MRRVRKGAGWLAAAALVLLAGCSTVSTVFTIPNREPQAPGADAPNGPAGELGRGLASWYGPDFQGKRTASGERFDMNDFTAAHRTLPFGTRVRVRNLQNGREVVVRINDRGPRPADRVIDLSKAAASALDLLHVGAGPVVLVAP